MTQARRPQPAPVAEFSVAGFHGPGQRGSVGLGATLVALALCQVVPGGAAELPFRRGDVDGNTKIEISDAVRALGFLFLGNPSSLGCMDAADANDTGKVDLSDGVFTLNFLFAGGPAPPSPGPETCGTDPTPDVLTCDDSPGCPGGPTPPTPPTGLTASAASSLVNLDWNDHPDSAVVGFNVYRSTQAGTGFSKLNGAPVAPSAYSDTAVTNGTTYFYRVTAVGSGSLESTPSSEASARPVEPPISDLRDIGHVLNRLTFGPTEAGIEAVQALGIEGFIERQLSPETIDESGNTELNTLENALFNTVTPTRDTVLLAEGALIRYFKGTQAPPAGWDNPGFNDATWLQGATGIGYGDGDDATVLADMEQANGNPGYWSVYLRATFQADPAQVDGLVLRVSYDDGFVAYLNGTEVARRGLSGTPPPFSAAGQPHEADGFEDIDISNRKNLLVNGANILAVQVHNSDLASSDLSMIPVVVSREVLPEPPIRRIKDIQSLQQLTHVRAVFSEKQLQTVLAEFWDNHFTTDYDKVAEYLDELTNADGSDAMGAAQAAQEAADLKHRDYQFYFDHALGNFEDLFIYQATSPAMLIYLDNVLNVKGVANENYPREILELFGFGVDNGYTQRDIEQLSKCFTGWNVCKIERSELQPFPESSTSPPPVCGVQFQDTVYLARGAGWRYRKGTAEPTPDNLGAPTTAWTAVGYDDATWLSGSTGIGYGDGDDATVLTDMQNNYRSVYLRRRFTLTQAQIDNLDPLLLAVDYDDAFVAYLNGVEVARSEYIGARGTPVAFDRLAEQTHEVSEGTEYFPLNPYRGVLVAGTNVLSIQVHNASVDSSDLSMIPEIRSRKILGGIDNGDPNGVLAFYFDPSKHDTTAKTLFQGTPFQMNIPAGRTGALGLRDAMDPVKAMVTHPSTKEFICIKLIQKFVSDGITIQTKNTAPLPLRALLADCIAAWGPRGDIRAVLEVIFDPAQRQSEFWSDTNYRNKVRTPTELVNASARVLEATLGGTALASVIQGFEWPVFTRDEPDGNPEDYVRSTGSLKDSIDFVQTFTENQNTNYRWSTLAYCDQRGLDTAQEIVDHFATVLFHGTLTSEDLNRLLQFLNTDANDVPKPLLRTSASDFQTRVQEFVGLLLSLPQWQFQ